MFRKHKAQIFIYLFIHLKQSTFICEHILIITGFASSMSLLSKGRDLLSQVVGSDMRVGRWQS